MGRVVVLRPKGVEKYRRVEKKVVVDEKGCKGILLCAAAVVAAATARKGVVIMKSMAPSPPKPAVNQ